MRKKKPFFSSPEQSRLYVRLRMPAEDVDVDIKKQERPRSTKHLFPDKRKRYLAKKKKKEKRLSSYGKKKKHCSSSALTTNFPFKSTRRASQLFSRDVSTLLGGKKWELRPWVRAECFFVKLNEVKRHLRINWPACKANSEQAHQKRERQQSAFFSCSFWRRRESTRCRKQRYSSFFFFRT